MAKRETEDCLYDNYPADADISDAEYARAVAEQPEKTDTADDAPMLPLAEALADALRDGDADGLARVADRVARLAALVAQDAR